MKTEFDLTQEEILNLVKENLSFIKKENNIQNFFLELKKLRFSALKHLSFIAPFIDRRTKQYKEEAVKLSVQLELADSLFRQGATVKEVLVQTRINTALLSALLRTYYKELPKSLLQFKLMQFRLYELILQNKAFLENYVLKDLKQNGKILSQGILSSMHDMLLANVEDKMFLDQIANLGYNKTNE